MRKIKNIKEAKDLATLYRSINEEAMLQTLKAIGVKHYSVGLRPLTGFSSTSKCRLCTAVDKDCDSCIHSLDANPNDTGYYCVYQATYEALHDEYGSVEDYIKAINARADHLEKLITKAESHGCD